MTENKTDLTEFRACQEGLTEECKKLDMKQSKLKRNILTLENYCEKYLPMTQLKVSFDLIKFVVEDPKKLVKQ